MSLSPQKARYECVCGSAEKGVAWETNVHEVQVRTYTELQCSLSEFCGILHPLLVYSHIQ